MVFCNVRLCRLIIRGALSLLTCNDPLTVHTLIGISLFTNISHDYLDWIKNVLHFDTTVHHADSFSSLTD